MSIKADISHFFALIKYILDNIDDRQVSMMTSFRKKISNTFILAGLSHKVVQYDQIPLRYVQVICVVDIVGNALIKLDSRYRPYHTKIEGLPLTITPNDTLRRWTNSFLCFLQESFHPRSLAALCTPSYDTCERMLHNTGPIEIVDNHGQSTAQVIVDEISNFSIQIKFQNQPIKCKEIRISSKQAPSTFDDLHLNGTTIEIVDSFQLLGLTIQNNLKWDKHFENICKKASKRLYFLSQLKRAKVQTKELVEFYVTCIRPVLTYACEVFNFNLQEKLK
jgi:hypothetical protein